MKLQEIRKESELLVFVKLKDLISYILKTCSKSPVKYRYSITNNLINNSLAIIENLYEANDMDLKDRARLDKIRNSIAKLKIVDFLTSLAFEAGCFTKDQYEVILEKIGVCSKYLYGYYNHSKSALTI